MPSNTVALIEELKEGITDPDALSELSVLIEEIGTNIEQIEQNKHVLDAENWRATLLLRASYLYIPKLLDFLIKHHLIEAVKNEVDKEFGSSAILFAAQGGYLDIVKMLYAEGADLTLQGCKNQDAVFYSLESGNEATFSFIWDKLTTEQQQASLKLISPHYLEDFFCKACEKGSLDVIKVLFEYDLKLIEANILIKREYGHITREYCDTLYWATLSLNDKVFNFIWDNTSEKHRNDFKKRSYCIEPAIHFSDDSYTWNANAFLQACLREQFIFAQNLLEHAPSMVNSKCVTTKTIDINALDIIYEHYNDSEKAMQFAKELLKRGLLPFSNSKFTKEVKDFFQTYFNMSILNTCDRSSLSNLCNVLIPEISKFFVSRQHLEKYKIIFNDDIEKRPAKRYNDIGWEVKLEDGAKVSDLIQNMHIEHVVNRVVEEDIAYIADIAIQAIRTAHPVGEQPLQSQLDKRKEDFQNWLRPILKKYYTDNGFALDKSLKLAITSTLCTIDALGESKRKSDPFYNVRYETKKAVKRTINVLQDIRKFAMDAIDVIKYKILYPQLDKIIMKTVLELDSFKASKSH